MVLFKRYAAVNSNFKIFFRSYSDIKLYVNYDEITSKNLNKLLSNQGISITQDDLNKLKKMSSSF